MKQISKILVSVFSLSALMLIACNEHELPSELPAMASSQVVASSASIMIDSAKNEYAVIQVGALEWAKQDLHYTKAGDENITCTDNVSGKCKTALYTYERAKNVCPTPWRLPTDAEWRALVIAAGQKDKSGCENENVSDSIKKSETYQRFPGDLKMGTCSGRAGYAIKSTQGWIAGNGADLIDFSGVPTGYQDRDLSLLQMGAYAYYWSASVAEKNLYTEDAEQASSWYVTKDKWMVHQLNYKDVKLAVRCVREVK
jgi:uncharacterized protein (TIGR02145 family)